VYSKYVVFREVRSKPEPEEIIQSENNLEMVHFELRKEEDDSNESIESEEEVEQQTLVVRRSERVRKPVERYSPLDFRSTFLLTSIDGEPESVDEAVESVESKLWNDAMVEEMKSLHKNETWDLVKLPSGINIVGRKWLFKKKMNAISQVKNFKARLVVK
jgi:hypothetical protein